MKKHQGGIVLWTLFAVVLIIFLSGSIAVYTVFIKPESKTQVPLLRDRPVVEAVAEAERLGLVVQLEPVESSMPDGRVLAQSPAAGTELRKGQVVVLQVSRGGELHAVPDVKGKTLAKAQEEIKSQGFSLGDVIKIREPNVQSGTVIAQSPAPPANIASGRKIDLLIQEGSAADENITVPDVNRMTEAEARNVIEASGLKVQAVDRVYSPLLPEGLAIETRPAAGSIMRTGQGVTLKLATLRRPAGYMDTSSNSNSNSNVRKVTSQQQNQTANSQTTQTTAKNTASPAQSLNAGRNVTVSVKGEEDVFIGDDYETTPAPQTTTANAPQTQQQRTSSPATSATSAARTSTPVPVQTQTQQNTQTQPAAQSSSGGSKTARIRYQVPPLGRTMDLRIEITDPSGKRDVMNRQVRSGESINTSASYTQECVITIYLGGELVWQERQR